MKFKKTWYSSSNDLTAIPDKLPADFEKVGATATVYLALIPCYTCRYSSAANLSLYDSS